MADLSSILGGMVQGFKDFGTGLVDFFGTGAANIGDIASSIATGRATTKNQDDFRKWLYQTDDTQDAAAKGLGTILNGVSTVADVMPGAQAVTANPLFNGLQGAIGGVSDELKMAGKDADWGRAAQRAGVGAASGLASAYAGQGLAKTGNKLLSNGLTRGAVSGALGGGIANAGYTGIEGGSVQDMINAGLYGAQTGALVGGTTGLARELIKPTHKMDVALTDDEKAARIANIDDQLGKLDLNTPEGNARYAELTAARENYEPKTYYHGSPELGITEFDINRAGKNTRSGEKAIYFTDTPEAAEEFAYERIPTDSIFMDKVGKRGGVYEANLDMHNTLDLDNLTDAQIRELWNYASPLGKLDGQEAFVQRLTDWRDKYHNPQLTKGYIDLEALRNSPYDSFSATMYPNTDNKAKEYAIFDASKAKITKSPKTVADLMNEPKQKTVADLMLSPDDDVMYSKVAPGQLGLFDQPMPKPEPEPVALPKSQGEQASLFDQPKRPIVETQTVDAEPVNPYAPVDGQVTQAMRDRAAEVLKTYAKKGVPDNELYNMIDESTLPAGYKEFREIVDNGKSYAKEKLGAESANKADLRRVVEYLYDDTAKQEEMLRNVKIEESNDAARRAMYGLAPRKSGSSFSEKMLRRAADEKLTKEFTEKIGKIENRVPELMNSLRRYNPSDLSVRKGLTAAADELYSERLGIAPGNTIKYNGPADVRNAYGRYSKQSKNLALTRSNVSDPEQAISTVAHERLHSFQNEADLNRGKYGATNRYDKRVTDAFDELRKELQDSDIYKSFDEISNRYGRKDATYYADTVEQEARMLQQYLNNKGYTDLQQLKSVYTDKGRSGEFGSEVNAPFDKFFDKLRALSKKGVALPALTALFGGGAIMAATQSDDKKKKSEVK